jgi:hypothetical protein
VKCFSFSCHQYLIDKNGQVLQRYGYKTYPYSFERDIVALLEGDYSTKPPLPLYDDKMEPCVNDILAKRPTMQAILAG